MLKIAVIDDYTGRVSRVARWAELDGVGAASSSFRTTSPTNGAWQSAWAATTSSSRSGSAPASRARCWSDCHDCDCWWRPGPSTGPSIMRPPLNAVSMCVALRLATTPAPEFTWALILGLARRVVWEDRALRLGAWQAGLGSGLTGKTLGIIGLGNIGTKIAAIAKAFGMEVVAWSQNLTSDAAALVGVRKTTKEELLASADFVTIHVVLSDRTRGLIGLREFSLMKASAYLINTSRGPIVDETALVDALARQRIAGAALDVFDVEPLPSGHPLREFENVILTPHLGYVTTEQYELFYGQAIENILAYTRGKLLRPLDPS